MSDAHVCHVIRHHLMISVPLRFLLLFSSRGPQSVLTDVGRQHAPHLLVDPALQLHDLVLHAHVQLLEVLHGAGLGPQPLQLASGPQASHAALQEDHGRQVALVASPGQPAPHPALDHHRLLLVQQLRTHMEEIQRKYRATLMVLFVCIFECSLSLL